MKRFAAVVLAPCFAFAIVQACNGGQLDAFVSQGSGGSATGGRGGATTGGVGIGGGPRGGVSGTAGEGGADTGDTLPIDDFEDGDKITTLNAGDWTVANDLSAEHTLTVEATDGEAAGGAGGTEGGFSLHTSGGAFRSYATVVCDVSGAPAIFDASDYAALTFVARAEPNAAGTYLVQVSFYSDNVNFAFPVQFGTDWERHTIKFTDVLPVEDPAALFDPRRIAVIQFGVGPDTPFDYWLDDLAFVR